jgi:histone H2A
MIRIGGASKVYLAGVLEYLTAELLEIACNSVKDNGKKRITPSDIRKAIV